MLLYQVLHIFFWIFHLFVTLFNLLGWVHPKTRRANAALLTLTLISWVGLGYFYGWGYCILTDWHWQVMVKLGMTGLPNSYIKYMIDTLTGLDAGPAAVETGTLVGMIVAVIGSALTNYLDWRKKSRPGHLDEAGPEPRP